MTPLFGRVDFALNFLPKYFVFNKFITKSCHQPFILSELVSIYLALETLPLAASIEPPVLVSRSVSAKNGFIVKQHGKPVPLLRIYGRGQGSKDHLPSTVMSSSSSSSPLAS
ncbi:hypothetical protein ZHAS_00015732 [Anopheles sinensis]|uniref:Uncharacterized protein n=1 Tax=Anopheles sinensis TaxID=74873 RepID=A0A084WBU2_ANOSI|nr:hypothetical protein ZHAS_00015732 [Anopheles sinensis]